MSISAPSSPALSPYSGAAGAFPGAAVRVLDISASAPSAVEAFRALRSCRRCAWLDSSRQDGEGSRFSILACEPVATFESSGRSCRIADAAGIVVEEGEGDVLVRFENWLGRHRVALPTDRPVLPFYGGVIGRWSYELGEEIEPAARLQSAAHRLDADMELALYDSAVIWDHQLGKTWLVGVGWERPPDKVVAALQRRLAAVVPRVPDSSETEVEAAAVDIGEFAANMTRGEYEAAVAEAQQRIAAGEIYQVNVAQAFRCRLGESPADTFLRLRCGNPAPMSAYVDGGRQTLLCSSPERFLQLRGRTLSTFPIKGTRPRGATAVEDETMRAELVGSEKERAELLMIVDLLRNDLGRICTYGSIEVRKLHELQTFRTVHHLVAEIQGTLRDQVGPAEILKATFPGGSITGAPKIQAMRLISTLEPEARGAFSGAVGYWSACGRMDLNIAIRTIVCRDGIATFHVGAGIVSDSIPAAEYEETLHKAKALFQTLAPAMRPTQWAIANGQWVSADLMAPEPLDPIGVYETIRLRGGEPEFVSEHAGRFVAGADSIGLRGLPDARTLVRHSRTLARNNTLHDGVLRWSAWRTPAGTSWCIEVTPPRAHTAKPTWRATYAALRRPTPTVVPARKTLDRKPWREALQAARAAGYDEAILLSESGEVVEGAITNLFAMVDGKLCTPPLDTGALPGIMRARVIELARQAGVDVRETRLTPGQLARATEVFVTNSLIGIKSLVALDEISFPADGPVAVRLSRHL
ncbi:MAG TPA: aminodeoxychorismate synthase component I [Lacunisphaera sp.]|nr:aminodeoxychorismate synthase component I [Lacunisphaera sp.]